MNFLLRSSSSQHLQDQQQQQPPADLSDSDSQGNASDSQISSGFEMEKLRVRMPVEGHVNVPSDEGFILIPEKELPPDWFDSPNSQQLRDLDRGFVFPGERIKILVSLTPGAHEGDSKTGASQLMESFKNSHFHVKITRGEDDEPELEESVLPVTMEQDGFDPVSTGGIARNSIRSSALPNGDLLVMLQLNVAALKNSESSLLEVLQFEKHQNPMSASKTIPRALDPAQDLLHWLLPLDRNSFLPPQQTSSSASVSQAPSSTTQKLSFAASNSTFFSFAHSRSSSQGSIPQVTPAPGAPTPPYPPSALNTAPGDWSRLYPEKDFGSEFEGVLSFRGVLLEPQRFSAHCGLEGLYVPGKRWSRKISVVQPLGVSSYVADCNTDDLICVLIENVLPTFLSDVIIYIDSISIICQTPAFGSQQHPVPIACIECGENAKLPDLPLRTGEQHSFILRPANSLLKPDSSKQSALTSRRGKETSDYGNYAALISCHSSHTHSKFYVKHSLKWKPRPPRDLLVSVSLENNTPTMVLNEALPQLKSQVVKVQTTNLTSKELDLTLLAPSSPPPCPPAPEEENSTNISSNSNQMKPPVRNSQSFREAREQAKFTSRSFSLPGRQETGMNQQDSGKDSPGMISSERNSSPAPELVAEASSPTRRSHLWLQSAVPLGRVPAHSTTVVKCDLLPLTEGIITLDSLHLATKDRGTLFFPENDLQIHSVSGIASDN